MNDVAIRVQNLSKRYRIGARQAGYSTIRETVTDLAVAPVRRLRRLGQPTPPEETIWALKDVSFEVKHGEVLGIIGRNGSGKTTLLKVLCRITEPTEGQAEIHGRVGSLLEVGTGFHPELTGRENIYLNGAILGMKRTEIHTKFDEIIEFAEIERFLDTPVKRYSSGMYVRLAFAVAAHLEPEILLVDEVLAVGDATFQKKCLGKMGDVAREGRTVLFVSHNLGAVQQLCGSVILLQSGTVVERNSPERVTSMYLSDASESADGVFDLAAHPARPQKYASIIKRIVLRSSGSSSRSFFFPDDSLVVELLLDASPPIVKPRLAVAIEDASGRRITTLASYLQQSQLPALTGRSTVTCSLPRLDLGPGRYLLSASVGTKNDGLLDSVDNAAWFEVGWRNNYGNGEPYYGVYGPVIRGSEWQRIDERSGYAGIVDDSCIDLLS